MLLDYIVVADASAAAAAARAGITVLLFLLLYVWLFIIRWFLAAMVNFIVIKILLILVMLMPLANFSLRFMQFC